MIIARMHASDVTEVRNAEGRIFTIGPGQINGVLTIVSAVKQLPTGERIKRFADLSFAFGDRLGTTYSHGCTLGAEGLWPRVPVQTVPPGEAFSAHAAIETSVNLNNLPPIRLADGSHLDLGQSDCEIRLLLRETEAGLDARLWLIRVPDTAGRLTWRAWRYIVAYQLSMEEILWRHAPRIDGDAIQPESEEYVLIRSTGMPLASYISPSDVSVYPPLPPVLEYPWYEGKQKSEKQESEAIRLNDAVTKNTKRELAEAFYDEPLEVTNQDGRQFTMGPGVITGALSIQQFVDSQLGVLPEHGLLRVRFDFVDAKGDSYAYQTVVAHASLFPNDVVVRDAIGEFDASVTLQMVWDTSGMKPFTYDDGRELWLGHRHNKYCDLRFELRAERSGIAVRMRAYMILEQPDFQDYVTVDYMIPLQRVLWRRAPRRVNDEIIPEAGRFVLMYAISPVANMGINPSPIRINS